MEVAGILVASLGMMLMTSAVGISCAFEMSRGDFLSFLCAVTFALAYRGDRSLFADRRLRIARCIQVAVRRRCCGCQSVCVRRARAIHLTPGRGSGRAGHRTAGDSAGIHDAGVGAAVHFPTRAALIFALEPVVAWLTSWLLTGETLANRGKVGAGSILAGILLVECTRNGAELKRAAPKDILNTRRLPGYRSRAIAPLIRGVRKMSFYDKVRRQKFLSFTLMLFTLAIGILIGTLVQPARRPRRNRLPPRTRRRSPFRSRCPVQNEFTALRRSWSLRW